MRVLLLAALFVLGASAAHAFPHITVISSEVIQADPLRVRTTFDVDLVGPGSWCWFSLVERGWWTPASGDTTKVYGGSPPPGWTTSGAVDHRVYFIPADNSCFGPGAHFAGFSIVTNNVAPCFHIIFATPLLGLDGSYQGDACLIEGATPARTTTWGALKSTYR
jgi:hypothetical protein